MNRRKRFWVITALICSLISASMSAVYAIEKTSAGREAYSIHSVAALDRKVRKAAADGSVSKTEQQQILRKTEPKVAMAYIDDVMADAAEAIEHADIRLEKEMVQIGDTAYAKEVIPLGNGKKVILEFEEGKDPSGPAGWMKRIFDTRVYAAKQGEVKWKPYGNRYFTAKCTVQCGVGIAMLVQENHYKVNKKGVTERYGISGANMVSGFGSVDAKDPKIVTERAAKRGKKTKMYSIYNLRIGVKGILSSQFSRKLVTKVELVDINKAKKRVRVKHTWKIQTIGK